ncbi:MAG TPA: elongation factor P [Planctomycetota bacterium]|nr:elongation factor P [Planctomycetota bacterium]
MLQPGDLKRGAIIDVEGAPCVIEQVSVQTPSSRSANTIWKVRARNLLTKGKVDVSYRSGDTIAEPNFEKRDVQYLYRDASGFWFMDLQDYDQFVISETMIGRDSDYLVVNMEGLRCLVLDGQPVGIEVPLTVDLRIAECDPAVKGNSATSRQKNATLETGLVVQVPEHLDSGEVVRIDTTTGKFVSRVSRG